MKNLDYEKLQIKCLRFFHIQFVRKKTGQRRILRIKRDIKNKFLKTGKIKLQCLGMHTFFIKLYKIHRSDYYGVRIVVTLGRRKTDC